MLEEEWSEADVYQMSPDTPLHQIENIGPAKLEIFYRAGLLTANDILNGQFLERIIQEAVDSLKREQPDTDDRLWKTRASLCMTVIHRLRNSDASPIHPEYLICPLSGALFSDAVITPLGHTYDRPELEKAFQNGYHFEPQAPGTPLAATDLVPNRAIMDAVNFYIRHMMRFNVLLKR